MPPSRQLLPEEPGEEGLASSIPWTMGRSEHRRGGKVRVQVQGIEILREAGEGRHLGRAEALGQASLLAHGKVVYSCGFLFLHPDAGKHRIEPYLDVAAGAASSPLDRLPGGTGSASSRSLIKAHHLGPPGAALVGRPAPATAPGCPPRPRSARSRICWHPVD